jgi:hypothetical protein
MRVSILQGSATGTEVYKEIYNPNPETSSNGLVSLEIGTGIPINGAFVGIDWAAGPYFIKVETDPTGGTNYSIVGITQLISVPYAKYAETAGNITGGYTETDPLFSTSVAAGITGTDTAYWNNKQDSLTAGTNITITDNVISAAGDGWGSQLVVNKAPLEGGGITGDTLEITPGVNNQVLATNASGDVVWRNIPYVNCGSTGNWGNGTVPTTWTVWDLSTVCDFGAETGAHLFLKFYSTTARVLYLRLPGSASADTWTVVDLAADRSVMVSVTTSNGQIEWQSSSNIGISWELVGFGR